MRDYVVIAIILASLPAILKRPWVGILMWYWIGLMNPHKLGWGIANSMPLAMIVGIVTIGAMLLSRDQKPIAWNSGMALIFALGGYFTLTNFFAWAPDEAWSQWDKVMKILLVTFISTKLIYGQKRIHALFLIIALSIGFYGFKGGLFSITTGGHYRVWGPENSFIGGNTSIGLAMLMVLPLLLYLAREEQRKWLRLGLYATFWLTVISTVFTYSRGALLGLAAITPLMLLRSNKKFLVVVILVPLAYFGKDVIPEEMYSRAETVGNYEQDNSSMQRIQAWGVALNVAKAHPLVGAGFNYEYAADADARWIEYAPFLGEWNNRARSTHSIYFQVLGQHGFIALALFIFLLLSMYIVTGRIRRDALKSNTHEWIANYALAIQIGTVGYIISGAFLSLAYFDLLYAYVAIVAILQRELNDSQGALTKQQSLPKSFVVHTQKPAATANLSGPEF